MAADPLVHLSEVLALAESLIGSVRREQATLPTPCRSWDVEALVAHLVNHTHQFTAAATGGRPDWDTPTPEIGGDWAGAFRGGAAELRAAWQRAGDLSQEIELPIGRVQKSFVANQQIAELAVHSWDLATATGQRVRFPAEACEAALVWARTALRPQYRGDEASGKAFGPQVQVPNDAVAEDRLAAFFGRHPVPAWTDQVGSSSWGTGRRSPLDRHQVGRRSRQAPRPARALGRDRQPAERHG